MTSAIVVRYRVIPKPVLGKCTSPPHQGWLEHEKNVGRDSRASSNTLSAFQISACSQQPGPYRKHNVDAEAACAGCDVSALFMAFAITSFSARRSARPVPPLASPSSKLASIFQLVLSESIHLAVLVSMPLL